MAQLIITPKTKIGELLESYPGLEQELISMSPAFEKLRNPVLRRTVARVATLQQVAAIGKLNLNDLVNHLRKAAGQAPGETDGPTGDYFTAVPRWFNENKVSIRYNAIPVIDSGGSPMNEILNKANLLKEGEILELKTPFVPAPVLDMLKNKGFNIYCIQREQHVLNYISRH